MLGAIDLETFMTDPLLGGFVEASLPQRVGCRLLDGLPPRGAEQMEIAEALLGRRWADDLVGAKRVAALIMGADSGKSVIASQFLLHRALFGDLTSLRPGQRAFALLVAPDTRLASIPLEYAKGVVDASPFIRAEVVEVKNDSIRFSRGTIIGVLPATIGGSAVRGRRFVAAVLEEVAFFRDAESRVNDREVFRAIRPRLLPGAQILGISTPYAKRGLLWDLWKRDHGISRNALVLQAPTELMRPDKATADLQAQHADDPVSARMELNAEFMDGVTSLFDADALEACVVTGRLEIAPVKGTHYRAFADPSGGRVDTFALAIGHRLSDGRVALDVVRGWEPPLNPSGVVEEVAAILKLYGIRDVSGDRYAAEWTVDAFQKHAIAYVASELSRSELYLGMVGLVNSGQVELLDQEDVLRQFRGLDRRRGRAGRDTVDHRPGSHDDLANAVAGVTVSIVRQGQGASAWITHYEAAVKREPARSVAQVSVPFIGNTPWSGGRSR